MRNSKFKRIIYRLPLIGMMTGLVGYCYWTKRGLGVFDRKAVKNCYPVMDMFIVGGGVGNLIRKSFPSKNHDFGSFYKNRRFRD